MYSLRTLEHFHSPRNVGDLEGATHRARVENPACGDVTEIALKVAGGRVEELRFRSFGCVAAIAAGSALTELVRGRPVEEAAALEASDVVEALGGLPRSKRHGAALAVEALRAALEGGG